MREYRVALGACIAVALLVGAPAAWGASWTVYTSEAAFLAALGTPRTTESWEGYDTGTCFDTCSESCGSISGVHFSSTDCAGEADYQLIETQAWEVGASSPPHVLTGGYPIPVSQQVIVMTFVDAQAGAGFYLTGLSAGATAASIQVAFADETSQTFSLGDDGGGSATLEYFGVTSDTGITSLTVTAGEFIGPSFQGIVDTIGIDDLTFAVTLVEDTTPPICTRRVLGNPPSVIDGLASDALESDSGVQSVELAPGAVNVTLEVSEKFEPGVPYAAFRVIQSDTSVSGEGVVLVTDGGGNQCTLRAEFTQVPPGPLEDFVLCSGDGILFQVTNDDSGLPGGTSACSSNIYTPNEPALPPGYSPSPDTDPFPCRVLTIDSPISGPTEMTYKKDGVYDPRLRLLFSRFDEGAQIFPPFSDVTEFIQEIANIYPDPTLLKSGRVQWSPVKVTCAILGTPDCSGIPPERDDDLDSYALCPATGPADCSDQRAFIYPGAPERCNGMDEDCDGIADNGNPGGGEACTVEGEQGACAEGTTRCENAAVVCEQTVFPTAELCDSSDNDCDGHTDENWLFGGYLPPVNTDGSSIFKWKRTVPFKFQLTNCASEFVSTASPTIAVYFYSQGIVGDELEDVQSSGNANTGINYRYDAASHQYIYNLDTRLLPPNNSYVVRTTINDGTPEGVSTHDVIISIRR